jgi:hypothetical protein
VVTLSAKEGWTFAGVVANSFRHDKAQTVNNLANSGVVTIDFPKTGPHLTQVTDGDLTGKVDAPVAGLPIGEGETPPLWAQYSVTVSSWGSSDDFFVAGKVYTATVTLTANEGYTFAGLEASFFDHDEADISNVQITDLSVDLKLTFPPVSGDSDGDGFSNDMEIDGGFDPYDPVNNPGMVGVGSGGLTIPNGKYKDMKTGKPITIEFTLGGFTGKANLYYAVVAQDAEAPALNTYQKAFPDSDGVAPGTRILDVTDAVNAAAAALGKTWKDGYDVHLALMKDGKVALKSVRLPIMGSANMESANTGSN